MGRQAFPESIEEGAGIRPSLLWVRIVKHGAEGLLKPQVTGGCKYHVECGGWLLLPLRSHQNRCSFSPYIQIKPLHRGKKLS